MSKQVIASENTIDLFDPFYDQLLFDACENIELTSIIIENDGYDEELCKLCEEIELREGQFHNVNQRGCGMKRNNSSSIQNNLMKKGRTELQQASTSSESASTLCTKPTEKMSAVIELDSSDDDNEVVEVTETTSEIENEARPNICLNPMGRLAKSQGFVKEFVDLINLCFKFESSLGMERILTRNLIPNYEELNSEYAKSDKLKCFLRNMFKKIKNAPNMKFCCLKEVSENFKKNKMKKKVGFVTLNNKASEKFKKYYNMQNEKRNKKKQDNIIILDENEDPHPQIINLDEEPNTVIDLESCDITNNARSKINDENCIVKKLSTERDIIIRPNTKSREPKNSIKRVHNNVRTDNKADCHEILDSEEFMDQTDSIHIKTNKTVDKRSMGHSNETHNSDCEENMDETNDESIETNHTVHKKNMAHKVNKKHVAHSNNIVDIDSDENMEQSDNELMKTNHIVHTKHMANTVHKRNIAYINNILDIDCEENMDQSNNESVKTNKIVHNQNMAHSNNIIDRDYDKNMDYSDKGQIETNDTVHKKNMANSNILVDSDSDENMEQSDNEHTTVETNTIHKKNMANAVNKNNKVHSDTEDTDSAENSDESDSDTIELDHSSHFTVLNKKSPENPTETHEIIDSQELINDSISIPISSNNNNYKSSLDLLNVSHVRIVAEPTELAALELEIKRLKDYLVRLEETEVTTNGFSSPYMEAHKTQLLIIKKYKKICQLSGETYKPRKCRQFQLQVKEGHPAGPARKLEEWLNTNVDKNGEPSFPNLRDVIMCVWVANQEDNLGWDINRTYLEAKILFTQCGQHLQRRRQQREWRDLLQTVKTPVDHDPADSDPQLLAKLEANRLMARAKFDGIIDHYAKLEDESRKKTKKEKPIKITDVKSLSDPNAKPTWEVPITETIREVPVTDVPITGLITEEPITEVPITGLIIEEVPITGLIQINRNAPSNNEYKTDIKKEIKDELVNNSTENNNQVVISNETTNNICEVALEVFNSVMKDNNKTSTQMNIDLGQTETNISQNNQNSSVNCQKPSQSVNANKVIEPNDVKNNNVNVKNEGLVIGSKSSSIVYGKHQICKIKSPVIELEENDKLSSEVKDQNNSLTNNLASQKASGNVGSIEKMDIEDLTSHNKKVNEELGSQNMKLNSAEAIEKDKITQNITNEHKTNTVTKNTQLDINGKNNVIDESKRTSNDQNLTNNVKEITNNVKNITNNDKNPTNNDKNPTNNDKNPTNNDKNPSNNDKNPTNYDKNPKNYDKNPTSNDKSKIKSEVKMEIDFSEEDFDLMLDQNFSCDVMASARVFDVEDTVVIIELSSSESESDGDDCQFISL